MEDIRYIAIQEWNTMILKALCDSENPELFEVMRNWYNQEDIFISFYWGALSKFSNDQWFGTERLFYIKNWRRPEDEHGLVGKQDVSHYG